MSEKELIKQLKELPSEAQKEANDFVKFLYDRYVKSRLKKSPKAPISESPFVGMWKDRSDLVDSSDWVRQQRLVQWTKR